ncbi:MAG: hypothetical protein JO271_04260 [Verrucomicrobia bacterium]|nr:hypothetical protein [Verrucomicrobiota bacterium]
MPSSKVSLAGGGEAGGALDDAIGDGWGGEAKGAVGEAKIPGLVSTIGVGVTAGAGVGMGINTDGGGCRWHWETR